MTNEELLTQKLEERDILRTAWLSALKTGSAYSLRDGNSTRSVTNYGAESYKRQLDIVDAEILNLQQIIAGKSGRAMRLGVM